MKIIYDKAVDAAYIYLCEIKRGDAFRVVDVFNNMTIMLDLDEDDRLLGIEVLGASKRLKPETLAEVEILKP